MKNFEVKVVAQNSNTIVADLTTIRAASIAEAKAYVKQYLPPVADGFRYAIFEAASPR